MALIICPECKREVSSYANACPSCGFPLIKLRDSNTSYDVILVSYNSPLSTTAIVKEIRHLSLAEAKKITDNVPSIIVSGVTKSKAEEIKKKFDAIDAVVKIRNRFGNAEENVIQSKSDLNQYSVILLSTNSRSYNVSKAFDESVSMTYKEKSEIIAHAPSVIKSNLTEEEAQKIYDIFTKHGISTSIVNNQEDIKQYWIYREEPEPIDEILRCPRCKSTAITTGSRGYSLLWGFLGSNKTVNRCGKCGYTWKP